MHNNVFKNSSFSSLWTNKVYFFIYFYQIKSRGVKEAPIVLFKSQITLPSHAFQTIVSNFNTLCLSPYEFRGEWSCFPLSSPLRVCVTGAFLTAGKHWNIQAKVQLCLYPASWNNGARGRPVKYSSPAARQTMMKWALNSGTEPLLGRCKTVFEPNVDLAPAVQTTFRGEQPKKNLPLWWETRGSDNYIFNSNVLRPASKPVLHIPVAVAR